MQLHKWFVVDTAQSWSCEMQPWCLLRAAESIETGIEARTSDTEGRQFNSAQGLHPITLKAR